MAEHGTGIKISDLKDDAVAVASDGKRAFAIVKHAGKVMALDGICTHKGGPLGKGSVKDDCLVCPWHGGMFNLGDGKASEDTPWVTDIKAYRTRVDVNTGEIFIGDEL